MATKSFTTTMTFNRKNVDSLYKALNNNKKAKLTDTKFNVVKDKETLRDMFSSRKGKNNA